MRNDFIEVPANKMSFAKRKLVEGAGVNDSIYKTSGKDEEGRDTKCPYYRVWHGMIERCFSKKYHLKRPTYKNCTVSEDWLRFSSFRKWMKSQNWQGMELDKDIKIIGNKKYSPETCLFVSKMVNLLLCDSAAIRGEWPIGVSFKKSKNKFVANCKNKGEQRHLGYFLTSQEAHNAYKLYKHKVILETANQSENSYIREYLLNHAELLVIKIDQEGES